MNSREKIFGDYIETVRFVEKNPPSKNREIYEEKPEFDYKRSCEICDDKETQEHHIVWKIFGGSDEDGRICLCKKHHKIVQWEIMKVLLAQELIEVKDEEKIRKILPKVTENLIQSKEVKV